ncbi:MAG: sugar transferase [Solirubrobacteraceae bacterium]|nr:sugar transferase [Patulibacter sp.]
MTTPRVDPTAREPVGIGELPADSVVDLPPPAAQGPGGVGPALDDEDRSLATAWPQTATARALVVGLLLAGLVAALLPAVSDELVTLWFVPIALLAVGAGKLALDLPLRTARPPFGLVALGVAAASLIVGAGVLAVLVLAGAGSIAAPVVVAAGISGVAFSAAVVLRGWEQRFLSSARRVLLVGDAAQRQDLRREIARHQGMSFVAFVEVAGDEAMVAGLAAAIAESRPTVVVFSTDAARSPTLCEAAIAFSTAGIRLATLADVYGDHFGRVPLRDIQPSWAIREIADLHRPRTYALVKQVTERVGAALVLVLFSPLLLLAAVLVRATTPGGVLYRQDRVGHRGATITILKIRTMRTQAGPNARWAGEDLHRVTAVGRFLRRFRIDEMPQLWNVVRGDLSLIGPRPEQVPIVARLADELPFYQARHWVRPGLTGWAQIRFGYGGSFDGARQKLEYDLYYVERQSLLLDLRIALGTIRAIVRGIGT